MSGVDRHTGKVIGGYASALQSVQVIFSTRIGELSAATLAEYRRVDRVASERAQARIDRQKRENEQAQALPATPAAGACR